MKAHSRETVSTLRTALGVAAESTKMSDDWDTIVTRLEREASEEAHLVVDTVTVVDIPLGEDVPVVRESLVTVGPKRWLVGAAAAVLIGLVVAAQPWKNQEIQTVTETPEIPEEVNLVLPGEIVLSEDPLIVIAAIGPEVRFDTSGLGHEVVFEPITELDDQINQLLDRRWGPSPEEASLTKGTLIGRISGIPFVTTISDGPDLRSDGSIYPIGTNLRFRSLSWGESGVGGAGAMGYPVELPSRELVINETSGADWEVQASGRMIAWSHLPAETAVVTLDGPFHQAWMRPRGGVAAFPVRFDDGEEVTIVAFDPDGLELGRTNAVVDRPTMTGSSPSTRVGDFVGVLLGYDGDDGAIRLEADGQTRVFLVGADWCRACNDDLAAAIETLSSIEAEVFVVPSPLIDDSWPQTDVPFPIFVPISGSALWNIGAGLPQVIVLDGEHRLVAVAEGFDQLILDDLGLSDS